MDAAWYGYSYFQGYYFSKPVILSAKGIPSNKLTSLKIFEEINKREINYDELETLILKDDGLCFKLMRLINSSSLGMRNRVNSVK
ncbi:MAG: HDOD domain-containing protein [Bacillota bacterium]|nr:HDOD domain-containing protein [Bacillota bacterium]